MAIQNLFVAHGDAYRTRINRRRAQSLAAHPSRQKEPAEQRQRQYEADEPNGFGSRSRDDNRRVLRRQRRRLFFSDLAQLVVQRRVINFSQCAWPCEIGTHAPHHVFGAGVSKPKEAAKTQCEKALPQVPPTVAVKHKGVDCREVAHFIEETRGIVLQVKVGVPHDDAVQRDRMPTCVHQPERHIVAPHKNRQRVVARDVDGECGVPPRRIRKASLASVAHCQPPLTQVVFLPEGPQRIQRPPEILATRFELHPLALFAEHCAMHAELFVARKAEERHGAHQCFGFKRDVVIHEQHVGRPLCGTQMHETTSEATCAAEIAIRHHREIVARRIGKIEVARVVDDQHSHTTAQDIARTHEIKHAPYRRHDVLLSIEGGDREAQSHVVGWCCGCRPLDALHGAVAFGNDSHVENRPTVAG